MQTQIIERWHFIQTCIFCLEACHFILMENPTSCFSGKMNMARVDQKKEVGSPLKNNESKKAYGSRKIQNEREKQCGHMFLNVWEFCWWGIAKCAMVLSEERWRKKWTCKQTIFKEHTSFGLFREFSPKLIVYPFFWWQEASRCQELLPFLLPWRVLLFPDYIRHTARLTICIVFVAERDSRMSYIPQSILSRWKM